MHSDLESLIRLQRVDTHISELGREREGFPGRLSSLEQTIQKAQDAVDAVARKIDVAAQEKKALESSIADAKSHLDKSQELLNNIKTNREYDAVHSQIENFKSVVTNGDSRLKKFDAESQQLQSSIDEVRAQLEKTKQENGTQIEQIKASLETINASIAQAMEERKKVVASIPKQLLRTYDYILKRRKNGQVLSYVNGEDRTCSVCFKILETQLVNEIRKSDKIIVCQNCGSIFVWKEEAKPSA